MSTLYVEPPPESLLLAIEAVAREQFGRERVADERLARAVRGVSEAYTRIAGSPAELGGDRDALCARLCFFLPRDFAKVQAPLCELAAVSALPSPRVLRVLDLGSGLGATGLSAAAFALRLPGVERVQIDAVDRDPAALAVQRALCERWSRDAGLKIELRTRCAPLGDGLFGQLSPPYHLVLLGFVLNELAPASGIAADTSASQHTRLSRLCELLAPDGALIVLEPSLREHSRALQQVRSRFAAAAGPPYVFAPCLHRGLCPLLERERDWCHEQLPLALPARAAQLARAAGLRDTGLSFSYLTLHTAERSLAELAPGQHAHRVVSAPLRSKGKLELLVCGADDARRLQRLDRHERPGNAALDTLHRGNVVQLLTDARGEGALLRVDSATEVRVLSAPAANATDDPRRV
jgi:ribosomal protein RSM22 (predicted rRNA methylase)